MSSQVVFHQIDGFKLRTSNRQAEAMPSEQGVLSGPSGNSEPPPTPSVPCPTRQFGPTLSKDERKAVILATPYDKNEFKNRKKYKDKERKKIKRVNRGVTAHSSTLNKHLSRANIIPTELDVKSLPHTTSGFLGRHVQLDHLLPTPEGIITVPRNENGDDVILDANGLPIVHRVSPSKELCSVAPKFQEAIERLRAKFVPSPQHSHNRGEFDSATFGISYGSGQETPKWQANDPCNQPALEEFRNDPAVLRYVKHATHVFKTWSPKLALHYEQVADCLLKGTEGLVEGERNFPGCPFMAATVNLGPNTVTDLHCDTQSLAYGLSCMIPFGDYLYKKGGHIILKELGLQLEVAPGDVVFLPSACITHGNTPLHDPATEKRYSVILSTAGQIFQWVENGCQSKKRVEKGQEISSQQEVAKGEVRWREGWALHSSIDELKALLNFQ